MKNSIFGYIILTLILSGVVFSQNSEKSQSGQDQFQLTKLGFSKIVDLTFEEALTKVKAELKKEGFGILTEVDVKATMKKKLGIDFRPYHILGACNPPLAHKALQAEMQIGLFLPCKFIVYVDEDDYTVVSAVDPVKMMQDINNPLLAEVAISVRKKFKKVLQML